VVSGYAVDFHGLSGFPYVDEEVFERLGYVEHEVEPASPAFFGSVSEHSRMVPVLREGFPEVSAYGYDRGSFRRRDDVALDGVQPSQHSLGIQFPDMDVGYEVVLPIGIRGSGRLERDAPRFPSLDERPKVVEEIFDVGKRSHGLFRFRLEQDGVRPYHFLLDAVDMRPYRPFHDFGKFPFVRRFYGVRGYDVRSLVQSERVLYRYPSLRLQLVLDSYLFSGKVASVFGKVEEYFVRLVFRYRVRSASRPYVVISVDDFVFLLGIDRIRNFLRLRSERIGRRFRAVEFRTHFPFPVLHVLAQSFAGLNGQYLPELLLDFRYERNPFFFPRSREFFDALGYEFAHFLGVCHGIGGKWKTSLLARDVHR
jgi:hypothetical protein